MLTEEMQTILAQNKQQLATLCQRYHIKSLKLFGSFLHGDSTKESDIDILVEFQEEHYPGLILFMEIQENLQTILQREVDLNTKEDLHNFFQEKVLKEAQEIYVAA